MAHSATQQAAPAFDLNNAIAVIGHFTARIIRNHPLNRELEKLNAMSDAELAARGTTRADMIRQMLRGRCYI